MDNSYSIYSGAWLTTKNKIDFRWIDSERKEEQINEWIDKELANGNKQKERPCLFSFDFSGQSPHLPSEGIRNSLKSLPSQK